MANLTPEMKDISFNNSFGFRPMAGTCEKCTFGRGQHSDRCVTRARAFEFDKPELRLGLRELFARYQV